MDEWVLEEKQGVKYFRLHFSETKLKNLVCLFITRVGDLGFNAIQRELFQQNLAWVQKNFNIGQVNLLRQIHSDTIYYLSENFRENYKLEGDGLFTDKPDIFLGVRVADCLPIYLFSPQNKVVGIIHSGRQGTLKLIVLKMIKMIQKKFKVNPNEINYALGPSIGLCCYNVAKEIIEQFESTLSEYHMAGAIDFRNNKSYIDIKKINQIVLEKTGIKKIADIALCSSCNTKLFYSARRDNSLQRNIAIIGYQD
jgi:hypothetical protein